MYRIKTSINTTKSTIRKCRKRKGRFKRKNYIRAISIKHTMYLYWVNR